MVLTTPMVLTKTHGIESVLLNHTRTRGPSVTRMRDFFSDHFSPMSGTLFFSEHLNWQVLSLFRLQLFSTRVLDIHLGGLKAACIGLDVSKFRPSVGDGAT